MTNNVTNAIALIEELGWKVKSTKKGQYEVLTAYKRNKRVAYNHLCYVSGDELIAFTRDEIKNRAKK